MKTHRIYTLDRDRTYHFVTLVVAALAGAVIWLATRLTPAAMLQEFGSIATGRLVQAGWLVLGVGHWEPGCGGRAGTCGGSVRSRDHSMGR